MSEHQALSHDRSRARVARVAGSIAGGESSYARLPKTVAGLHFVAFTCMRLRRAASLLLRAA